MGVGGEREEARHGFVDERGSGDEDVVHLGEQVFAGGVGVVAVEDITFEDGELGGIGHGGGREGEVSDDGDALAGDEGRVGMERTRPVVFLAGAKTVGEGAHGMGVVGVDGGHADAGVFEVPGLGEDRDVTQRPSDQVGGVLGGARAGLDVHAEGHADAVFTGGDATPLAVGVDRRDGDVGGDLVDELVVQVPGAGHGLSCGKHEGGSGMLCRTLPMLGHP